MGVDECFEDFLTFPAIDGDNEKSAGADGAIYFALGVLVGEVSSLAGTDGAT